MSDKKSIFKSIVNIILTIFMVILIILTSVVFISAIGSSCSSEDSSKSNVAYADSVQDTYIYRGSNFIVPTTSIYYNSARSCYFPSDSGGALNMTCDYIIRYVPKNQVSDNTFFLESYTEDYVPLLAVRIAPDYYSIDSVPMVKYHLNSNTSDVVNCPTYTDTYNNTDYIYYDLDLIGFELEDDGQGGQQFNTDVANSGSFMAFVGNAYYSYIDYSFDIGFSPNIIKFSYSSNYNDYWKLRFGTDTKAITNTLTLFDSNNKTFVINFLTISKPSYYKDSAVMWENRLYYITNDFNNNEFYSNGYNDGYNKALTDNKIDIADRLNDYYQQGFDAGRIEGISEGITLGSDNNGFNLDMFLNGALSILDVELFGLFSLGDMLTIILGFTLTMFALKLFAGG